MCESERARIIRLSYEQPKRKGGDVFVPAFRPILLNGHGDVGRGISTSFRARRGRYARFAIFKPFAGTKTSPPRLMVFPTERLGAAGLHKRRRRRVGGPFVRVPQPHGHRFAVLR